MPQFRERIAGLFAASSSTGVGLRVTGDSQDRVTIDAGGRISWGSGAAATDVSIQRGDVLLARLTGSFVVNNNASGDANSGLRLVSSVATTHTNWRIGAQMIVGGLEFTPSTAAGGTTFSTPSMVILNTGAVGIGTNSPSERLQVIGNARIGQASNSSTNARLEVTSGGSGFDSVIDLGFWDTFDASVWLLKRHGSDGTFRIVNSGTGSEVPVITITNGNNVGIGTTSPVVKLDVSDGAGWFRMAANGLQTNLQLGRMDDGAGTPLYRIQTDDTNGDVLRFYSTRWGSNVRFARSSATGDKDNVWIDGADSTGGQISFFNGSNTVTSQISGVGNTYFNGGKVGIGTSSPSANYSLSVSSGAANTGLLVGLLALGSSSSGYPVVGDNLRFTNTGNSYQYHRNDTAALIDFAYGDIGFDTAPSGTAGAAITKTRRMTIANTGAVTIGGSLTVSSGITGSLSGNATTATRLETARTIGGVSFDGTANINLPGVNTTGNQNTTGSAATLTTARTINDVSFNGGANITVPRIKSIDDRVIAPADVTTGYATVAFTSWNNNNTAPYGDALVMRTYSDATGGKDNMLVLRKDALGLRVFQQDWNSATAFATYKDVAWTDGSNATGSWSITAANAELLDSYDSTYFAPKSELEKVLGDLMFAGTYDAAALGPNTKPTPQWSGGTTNYRHGMYWVVSTPGYVSYFTPDGNGNVDLALREGANATNQEVKNGDWIVCQDPNYSPTNPVTNLPLASVIFRFISFSAENFVSRAIDDHARDGGDPHSAAGYVTAVTGLNYFAAKEHNHTVDINNAVTVHRTPPTFTITNKALTSNVATLTTSAAHVIQAGMGVRVTGVDTTFNGVYVVTSVTSNTFSYAKTASNVTSTGSGGQAIISPHPEYLHSEEAVNIYAPIVHRHDSLYEPIGTVAGHEAKADPHPQYLTPGEGDARYTLIGHNHHDLYYTKPQVDAAIASVPAEVFATDGAQSRRIFVGDAAPSSPLVGDIWIQTANIAQQPPAAPSGLTATSPNGTTVNLSWSAWPSGASQTRVRVQRRNGSDWTTITPTTILDDATGPLFDLTFSDTGRTENTPYFYRVWANNSSGDGAYGYVDVTTANDAPGAPSFGATPVSNQTATGMRLSWTAPTPFADPAAGGARYEMFLNGISVGFAVSTNTFFDYTNLTERTSYTLGVRAKDAAGLVSPIASTTVGATTDNAAPPPPKSAASSGVTHNQATLTWAAGDPIIANGHPAGGITDFLRYRVYSNDVEVAQTTNTSYTFTNLAASTAYKLEARAEDTLNVLSTDNAAGSFVNITTSANPDTTPPAVPTITSFKPVAANKTITNKALTSNVATLTAAAHGFVVGERVSVWDVDSTFNGTWVITAKTTDTFSFACTAANVTSTSATGTCSLYGMMEVSVTWPSDADTNLGEIVFNPGGNASATTWTTSVSPGGTVTRNFYTSNGVTSAPGNTASVSVRARDTNNNWSSSAQSTYSLITSPYLLAADSSNSWRNESGGRYNSSGNYRLVQGYFSNSALNSTGLWYYGTKIADQVWSTRRTFNNVEIFMQRNTGGDGVARDVSIVLHNETVNPGNAYQAGPTTYETPTVVATLAWNGGNAWAIIPSGWRTNLLNGTRKGVAIKDTDGIPYVILDSVSENGQSGTLRITHLG